MEHGNIAATSYSSRDGIFSECKFDTSVQASWVCSFIGCANVCDNLPEEVTLLSLPISQFSELGMCPAGLANHTVGLSQHLKHVNHEEGSQQ